jgi:hypothetical protein
MRRGLPWGNGLPKGGDGSQSKSSNDNGLHDLLMGWSIGLKKLDRISMTNSCRKFEMIAYCPALED